jgi:IS30 family transposase
MGRKSSLTAEQWIEIERRMLVEGESAFALAKEFGVNESSIRRKIKPNSADKAERAQKHHPELRDIAADKVKADAESRRVNAQIAALPYPKQQIVSDLARKLTAVSSHLASAAEVSAASAHRLSILANQQLEKVDDAEPMKSVVELQAVAVLQKLANTSSEIGLNLLRANKDAMQVDDEPPAPTAVVFAVQDARRHGDD